ncbi:MAG: HEAT repeat domain-containing protein [SAR202 cluster bacterium]|nr:HEAT repeat domain-containing protein [SAR202 cluster bacterium]MDP6512439.1 HEAT repeat domain-containing protein [SAR202 cluster bacterium]MDP6715070.1 HEAT repeat domain-containing protein [SAR202 cluster bacterium]
MDANTSKNLQAKLSVELKTAVDAASEEIFEDGIESEFSRTLNRLVQNFGEPAVKAIEKVICLDQANVEITAEAVQQLGSIENMPSHQSRKGILLRNLESPDARLRDAASIGLSAMDDPTTIQALRDAISRESSPALQRNLQLVLDQLEETSQWLAS